MFYEMHTNPVGCGEFCDEFSVHRTDYDLDNDRILAEVLASDQPLSATAVEYIKQHYCIYTEPKCRDLPMADFYTISTDKIVSDKLRIVLESVGVAGEYVPITALDEFNNSQGKYYLAHFFPIVDSFDYEQSDFTWVERKGGKRPSKVKLLALDESKIPKKEALFRIKLFQSRIVVIEQVKTAVESADIKGVMFLPFPVHEMDSIYRIRELEKECDQRRKRG